MLGQTLRAWEEATEVRVRPPLPLSVLAAFVVFARAQACVSEAGRDEWLRFAIGVGLQLRFFGYGLLRLAVVRIEAPKTGITEQASVCPR